MFSVFEKQIQIIGALTEGLSMRSMARLMGVDRETVGRLTTRRKRLRASARPIDAQLTGGAHPVG